MLGIKLFRNCGVTLFVLFTSNSYASLPVYPAEIMGRDLLVTGAGWLGHVGVATAPFIDQNAYQVYEALNEDVVLQLNLMGDFMSRSQYWGSRYGVADRGERAVRLLREANAQVCLGAEYTITSMSSPAKGDISSYPNCRTQELGLFRCDTFLVHSFSVAGYDITSSGKTSPTIVFAQFPNGNGDGPRALESNKQIKTTINKPSNVSSDPIDTVTSEEIEAISSDEFMEILDVPRRNVPRQTIEKIWKLSLNPKINSDKRLFLMDYLGSIANLSMISDFIEQYPKIDNPEIKSLLLRNIQIVYQKYSPFKDHPHEKELLVTFYNKLLNQDLSIKDSERVARGFIDLNSNETILVNFDKIEQLIDKLNPYIQIGLKTNLLFKSKKLEKVIIPDIINMLNTQNNAQLDERFFLYIIDYLSRGIDKFDPDVTIMISTYLDSVKYKFDANKVSLKPNASIFSNGAWLEASALINSNTLDEAGSYVGKFLGNLNSINERESYVIGLSSKDYMKKAFSKEPALIKFKNKRKEVYLNTVGATPNK